MCIKCNESNPKKTDLFIFGSVRFNRFLCIIMGHEAHERYEAKHYAAQPVQSFYQTQSNRTDCNRH